MKLKNTIVITFPEIDFNGNKFRIFGFPRTTKYDPGLLEIDKAKFYNGYRVVCLNHCDTRMIEYDEGCRKVEFTMYVDSNEARNKAIKFLESVGAFNEAYKKNR